MGKVLEMPRKRSLGKGKNSLSNPSNVEAKRSIFSDLEEDDKIFIEIIKNWPCFSSLKYNIQTNELFHKYCNDHLTQSQECVIDLMLHIHDSSFIFDVNSSLMVWNKSDRDFFLYFLEQHAHVLNQ